MPGAVQIPGLTIDQQGSTPLKAGQSIQFGNQGANGKTSFGPALPITAQKIGTPPAPKNLVGKVNVPPMTGGFSKDPNVPPMTGGFSKDPNVPPMTGGFSKDPNAPPNTALNTPTKPSDVQAHLNAYQSALTSNLQGSDLTNPTAAVANARPTPPNLTGTYTALAGQYGISDLMKQLTDIQTQKAQLSENVNQVAQQERNQPITADVAAGRTSEAQQQAQFKLNDLNVQETAISTQLQNAQSIVSMIMGFTQQDYTNAAGAYDAQFNQNMQQQQLMFSEAQFGQKIASANWTTVTNLMANGMLNYSKMTDTQKSQINQFEVQAGLPIGTTAMLSSNPRISQILLKDPVTGQTSVQLTNGNMTTLNTGHPQIQNLNGHLYIYNPQTGNLELQGNPYQTSILALQGVPTQIPYNQAANNTSSNSSGNSIQTQSQPANMTLMEDSYGNKHWIPNSQVSYITSQGGKVISQ